MSEPFLQIIDVSKRFDNVVALDKVNLKIAKSEIFSLLGSSGCGKSTLLRIIAGFEKPDEGRILLEGKDITKLPPYVRPLNIMFQNYALFPHLNVTNNIQFGLKEEKISKEEINHRVNEILNLLELNGLEKRKINEISGGQQQRVALARCLVKKPKLLLLDEPLAALDKQLRVQTQFELVNLQYKLGITFIIVTHDQEEAMSLSDRMAIMKNGEILQVGNPVEIYEKPKDKYIANFIGTANIFNVLNKNNQIIIKELNYEVKNINAPIIGDLSNIDELNEVMRIHGTGQVTICEPNQGHTPSSTHRIRVSGGTVQSGGIELLQHAVSGSHGVYNTGIRHHAWNEVGKTNRYSNMVHTRYHCEKVWVKTFANGVANQQVRIQFPDYSTWTNGFIYIHTTYSNGNASGLLTYLFTHNANAGNSYGKDVQEIYSIGSTNSHMSMSNSWSFVSWGNNGGHNGENTHALEIRRDGSTAGNAFKIHLVIFGDNGTQHLESAYLTEGTY